MGSISVSHARREMSQLVNRVAYGKERIYLTSHEKKIVALVPIEDVEALEAIENEEDIREAELALKEIEEKGSIPIAEVRRRLRNKE
jgi:prevent-host-death family protein